MTTNSTMSELEGSEQQIEKIRSRLLLAQNLLPTRDEVDILFAEIDRLRGIYQSAVKGRQDFRRAYRRERDKNRA